MVAILSDDANDETLRISTTANYPVLAKRIRENLPKPNRVNLTTQDIANSNSSVSNSSVGSCNGPALTTVEDQLLPVLDALKTNTTVTHITVYGDFVFQHHSSQKNIAVSSPRLLKSFAEVLSVNNTIRSVRYVERGRKFLKGTTASPCSSGGIEYATSALATFLGTMLQVGPDLTIQSLSMDDPFTVSLDAAMMMTKLFHRHPKMKVDMYLTIRSVDVMEQVTLAIRQLDKGMGLCIQNLIGGLVPIRKLCEAIHHISSLDIALAQTQVLEDLGEAMVVPPDEHPIRPRIQTLNINVTPLTGYHPSSISNFFRSLQSAKTLSHLGFFWYRQSIPQAALDSLVETLVSNPTLKSFAYKQQLCRDDPTHSMLLSLRPALMHLTKFSFGVSVVGDNRGAVVVTSGESTDAEEAWRSCLEHNTSLEELEVTSLLSKTEMLAIVKAIPTMPSLRKVTMTPKGTERFTMHEANLVVEAVRLSPRLTDFRSSVMFLPKRLQSEIYYHMMLRKIDAPSLLRASTTRRSNNSRRFPSNDSVTESSSTTEEAPYEVPLALWPFILGHLDKGKWSSIQFDFLRQKADVLVPKNCSTDGRSDKSTNNESCATGANESEGACMTLKDPPIYLRDC